MLVQLTPLALTSLTALAGFGQETTRPPVRESSAHAVPRADPGVWRSVGSKVPSIELPRVDGGGLVDLAAFEGKKVLLLQFASW